MDSIDIKNALSKVQKDQLKKDISRFLADEIYDVVTQDLDKLAKAWLKENKEWLDKTLDDAMRKEIKNIANNIQASW